MKKINQLVNELKKETSPKVHCSIDRLNQFLKNYYDNGGRDFKPTSIGKMTEELNILSLSSIRHQNNYHYRRLIEAWRNKAFPVKPQKEYRTPSDWKYLDQIQDISLRQVFAEIINERNLLKREFKVYKKKVDMYELNVIDMSGESNGVNLQKVIKSDIENEEIETLKYSISDACFKTNSWYETEIGQIKSKESDDIVFPRGFTYAIRKILNILGELDE